MSRSHKASTRTKVQITEPLDSVFQEGVVTKKLLGTYIVESDGETVTCNLSSKLRKVLVMPEADPTSIPRYEVMAVKDIRTVDPVAIGDRVRFTPSVPNGLITDVLPRRNKLSRLAEGRKQLEQVIVANVDQMVAVFAAAQPEPRWNLLDRYLVTAEAADIPAVICITKLDLCEADGTADDVMEAVERYRLLGYPVYLTSAARGEGIEEVRELLRDRTSVMIGRSGVGKTSLLNALQPDLGLKVGTVSKKLKEGKHTTTHLEMMPLDFGGALIDTPGMREFHIWNPDDEDTALFFREMRPYVGRCKFGIDCTHAHEPGCAIRAAVENGQVSQARYHSYLRLHDV
ncbi:MAG: ribosome small subunit-dependent GTPase A [bacterium]|nr:ribosome small subunit-dependent GTPase A [bacterium]